ncbi:MAG: DUF1385 domain-containing protein [Synergistaceae bacterium]|jgi:uncharacterized protein YqhQ|nr:DUF1385 domain-containing protein [Synergistaceae bacterium]
MENRTKTKIRIRSTLASLGVGGGLWIEEARRIPVGGQAVIEGVLMKGADLWGLAIRQSNGEIFRENWKNSSRTKRYPWKLPLIRGFITMIEMMGTGFRALNRSAEIALSESEEKLTFRDLAIAITIGIFAVVGLFIALPLWLSEETGNFLALSATARNALEGVFRGLIFVAYVALIGLMKDIREVFRYHGAEHKTINAFENELEMTPQAVASQSRIHPRCGTSFLLIAIIISIAVFSVVGKGGLLWRVGSRVVLLPLVVGISYEIIRLTSKSGPIGKLLMYPVLSLQYLTTRVPGLAQIEVALASLDEALNLKNRPVPEQDGE